VRRTIIIGTAIAMLVGASAAFAASAFNAYTATFSSTSTKAGTAKSPVPLGFTQVYTARGLNGDRAAPLTDLKTTIYGLKSNGKDFPTCSLNKIANAKNDNVCNPKAEVATGTVNSLLGGKTDPKGAGGACNPGLDVWNAGGNKVVFFFTAKTALQCGSLETGATNPFYGFVSYHGKNMVLDVPQPLDISTKVANQSGLWSSLKLEKLKWLKRTTTVKGKTVGFIESIGCKSGKRPWKQSFSAVNYPGAPGGATQTTVVTGSPKCS
jgi:hypothetical protein